MRQRRGEAQIKRQHCTQDFLLKTEFFRDRIMGVETPIPPIMIYAAAPGGAPSPRINDGYFLKKNTNCPAVPRRGAEAGVIVKIMMFFFIFIVPV